MSQIKLDPDLDSESNGNSKGAIKAKGKAAPLAGVATIAVTSTNNRPPASRMGALLVSCQTEIPSGFIASVIIC